MRRWLLVGGLVLAFAGTASTQSTPPSDVALSPAEILSKPLAPAPGAIPDAGTKSGPPAKSDPAKSSAKKPEAAAPKPATPKATAAKHDPDGLEQCLRTWDAATHMTRGDWARVCRAIVAERARRTATEQRAP
jgi:hypothetical protein